VKPESQVNSTKKIQFVGLLALFFSAHCPLHTHPFVRVAHKVVIIPVILDFNEMLVPWRREHQLQLLRK